MNLTSLLQILSAAAIALTSFNPGHMGQERGRTANSLRQPLERTSLVALLAAPERFQGLRVSVSGYLHPRMEDSAVYVSKTDGDYGLTENALWVTFAEDVEQFPVLASKGTNAARTLAYYNCRYVTLTGTFDKDERGHMSAFAGGLKSVFVVQERRQWFDGARELSEDPAAKKK